MDGLLGVAGMIIDSYCMLLIVIVDHSRKFPAFSTSKMILRRRGVNIHIGRIGRQFQMISLRLVAKNPACTIGCNVPS